MLTFFLILALFFAFHFKSVVFPPGNEGKLELNKGLDYGDQIPFMHLS